MEVLKNARLNPIAVDTRNGMSSRALLSAQMLCCAFFLCMLTRPMVILFGVISNGNMEFSDEGIAHQLRSEVRLARIQRHGKITVVKPAFHGTKFPEQVLLGHARHSVANFKDGPLQCHTFCEFRPLEAMCQRPKICSNSARVHA